MKLEELYQQEKHCQVGITFQRVQYETEIDILPQLNPFPRPMASLVEDSVIAEITSTQTEEKVNSAVQYEPEAGDENQGIPLKRIDSGPYQHRLQEQPVLTETIEKPSEEAELPNESRHLALLYELDRAEEPKIEDKVKTVKKGNTLSRMLKGMRGDKSEHNEDTDKMSSNAKMSKIFHRINPVGKTSRESVSRVLHRIGDALQKRTDDERNVLPKKSKQKALEKNEKSSEDKVDTDKSTEEQKIDKIGSKMFGCQLSDVETDTKTLTN